MDKHVTCIITFADIIVALLIALDRLFRQDTSNFISKEFFWPAPLKQYVSYIFTLSLLYKERKEIIHHG